MRIRLFRDVPWIRYVRWPDAHTAPGKTIARPRDEPVYLRGYSPHPERESAMSACEHLENLAASDFPPPRTPNACEDCLNEGTQWVQLRECRTCGDVGCCDSSPRKHATAHFHQTQHPVMRSIMPGDAWAWCYLHSIYGDVGVASRHPEAVGSRRT